MKIYLQVRIPFHRLVKIQIRVKCFHSSAPNIHRSPSRCCWRACIGYCPSLEPSSRSVPSLSISASTVPVPSTCAFIHACFFMACISGCSRAFGMPVQEFIPSNTPRLCSRYDLRWYRPTKFSFGVPCTKYRSLGLTTRTVIADCPVCRSQYWKCSRNILCTGRYSTCFPTWWYLFSSCTACAMPLFISFTSASSSTS